MPKTYTAAGSATAGDVYTASAHNVIVTDVNNLIVPPIVIVRRAANQSIANNSIDIVSFDTEDVDTDGCFAATSTNITIQTTGVYHINAIVAFASNTAGGRDIGIRKNGTIEFASGSNPNVNFAMNTNITGHLSLTASDVITLYAYQNSGGALNATARLSLAWIGRTS